VTLRVLVRTVGPSAGFCEFARNLRVHKQALVAISALREILTRLSGMDKLTLTVLLMALGPERALDFCCALAFHLFRHV